MKVHVQYVFRAHNTHRVDDAICTIEVATSTFTRRIENAVEGNLRATHELWLNTNNGWMLLQQRES